MDSLASDSGASSTIFIGLFVVGLLIGGVFGCLLGWIMSRQQGATQKATLQAERNSDKNTIDRLTAELEASKAKQEETTAQYSELSRAHAALQSSLEEREKSFAEQRQQLQEVQTLFSEKFKVISQGILDEAQQKFLQRADARFQESENKVGANLKALLQPVQTQLGKYEATVRDMEKERNSAFAHLKGQLETLRDNSERVSSAATNLAGVLRESSKTRGNWGERQLRNVLEKCGLSEYIDFDTEVSVTDSDGATLRPDVVIRIPGGQNLIIDAKTSLKHYQDAFEHEDEAQRTEYFEAHAKAMRNHVKELSAKAYWEQFADAPDFVIMFVPGEHFLATALDYDRELWSYAFDNRVLLATPTNLVAIAHTVSAVWKQETIATEAREIATVGRELYKRMATMGGHIGRVGKNLSQTNQAYNDFIGSFESRVMTQARRFEELGVETAGKELPALPAVEQAPRLAAS